MNNSGKWLIAFIFGTALVMAIFAWSFQFLRGRRVLELYGADSARLIRVEAEKVELLRLGEAAADASRETLEINHQRYVVEDTLDISRAQGLIHARQALIEDSSYDWDRDAKDCVPNWSFALRFSHGDAHATAAIDVDCRRLMIAETSSSAPLAEHFQKGLQTFVDEKWKLADEAETAAQP